jgi:beta-galactosidase
MVHGGTNFAFTSGANYSNRNDIQPDLTSYDYDAPISEAGWATPKYDSIRAVIQKHVDHTLPAIPSATPLIEIPSIRLTRVADMLETVRATVKPVESEKPMTFEDMKQGYGYVLYSRHFNQPANGTLDIAGLRDYALIYVDGVKVGELNRRDNKYSMEIEVPFNSSLEILVENMGRINYGAQINDNTKGIQGSVTIGGEAFDDEWEMFGMPMDEVPSPDSKVSYEVADAGAVKGRPALYTGEFNLTQTGDTFLDMGDWGKGIVFINGRNIGRYWYIGPQQTLYIPGVWLKEERNEIAIFEQINDGVPTEVKAVKVPVLTDLRVEMPTGNR